MKVFDDHIYSGLENILFEFELLSIVQRTLLWVLTNMINR